MHAARPKIVGSGSWGLELFATLYDGEALNSSDDAIMLESFVSDGIDPEDILNAFAVLIGDRGRTEMANHDLRHTLLCLSFFITDTSGAYHDAMCSVPLIHSVVVSLHRQATYCIDKLGRDNIETWILSALMLRSVFI